MQTKTEQPTEQTQTETVESIEKAREIMADLERDGYHLDN